MEINRYLIQLKTAYISYFQSGFWWFFIGFPENGISFRDPLFMFRYPYTTLSELSSYLKSGILQRTWYPTSNCVHVMICSDTDIHVTWIPFVRVLLCNRAGFEPQLTRFSSVQGVMNTHCWINSTFTYIINSTSTSYMPHPG